jgi:hypothetical protein
MQNDRRNAFIVRSSQGFGQQRPTKSTLEGHAVARTAVLAHQMRQLGLAFLAKRFSGVSYAD